MHLYGYKVDSLLTKTDKKINYIQTLSLLKTKDWEATTQDSLYFYVGDFGNNYKGNRKDLRVLKFQKTNYTLVDTLNFVYENQTDFTAQKTNKTNFDCEAMISYGDHLYLFTKQWEHKKTTVYSLPNVAGTQVAKKGKTFDIEGLITDATYLENKKLLVLSGYSETLSPFIYVFYDFKAADFFGGNKRKFKLGLTFHQVEGITTMDGLTYYLTNEKVKHLGGVIDIKPKLHVVDLSPYLKDYLNTFDVELDTFTPEIIEEEVELNIP